MIFIDSNVPMYLVGARHPNKERAIHLLEQAIEHRKRLVTDAEVLQEILRRYVAIDRRDAIQPAFDALLGVVDDVFPVEVRDVERAKALLMGGSGWSSRVAMHAAVMMHHRVEQVLTFDAGFERVAGVERYG